MRILAVCGSLKSGSSNHRLLRVATERAPDGVSVVLADGVDGLPHFNPDLEAQNEIESVERWRDALRASDAVLIASPEYGHSLPGSLKNAIDWVIGSGELERKVVAITAATVSTERGRLGLRALAGTLGAVRATVVGGEPIALGETFDAEVASLVRELVAAVERDARERAEE